MHVCFSVKILLTTELIKFSILNGSQDGFRLFYIWSYVFGKDLGYFIFKLATKLIEFSIITWSQDGFRLFYIWSYVFGKGLGYFRFKLAALPLTSRGL